METSASPIYQDGEIHSVQVISRDVTHRMKMEENIREKWSALKNAPIGIYIIQDRKFAWVNQRFVDQIGYSEDELIGMDANHLVVSEDRKLLRENIIRMLKGQTIHPFEYRTADRKTGKERWVRGEVASTIYNGQRAVLGYYSDIDILMMQNITDSLTGLYNRRYTMERTKQMVDNSKRYGHPASFMLFDVDHFKQYNDNLGHIEGDRTLEKIGQIVKYVTRKVDISGRYGGEEFCVVLPNTSLDFGLEVAHRIITTIEEETMPPKLKKGLTVSLGLAELKSKDTLLDLIKKADDKLYSAKTQGRNQIAY